MQFLKFIGELTLFSLRVIAAVFRPPYEARYLLNQIREIGNRSLPLVLAAGFSLGVVIALHTRGTLLQFGAEAMIPSLQSMSFFNELGPLITGLLVAGRVGAGIGAELANMRVTEQIDGLESLSIDSFNFLVVTRVIACVLVMPLLTTFMNAAGLAGGYLSEYATSHISAQLYIERAFSGMSLVNFVPTTLKTTVFGFIIGAVSCFYGYTINEGSDGVRRAATNSVVFSSLLIILADVVLVKFIFFIWPEKAL